MTHPALEALDRAPLDEPAQQRLWQGIERRAQTPLPLRRSPALAVAAAISAAAAVLVAVQARRDVPVHASTSAPLLRAAATPRSEPATEPEVVRVATPIPAPPAHGVSSAGAPGPAGSVAAPARRSALVAEDTSDRNAGYLQHTPEPVPTVDELFARADAERAASSWGAALATLDRIVVQYPTDRRAGLAALTQGRIRLDALGDRAGASRALDRAAALGVPEPLRGDLQDLRRALAADR